MQSGCVPNTCSPYSRSSLTKGIAGDSCISSVSGWQDSDLLTSPRRDVTAQDLEPLEWLNLRTTVITTVGYRDRNTLYRKSVGSSGSRRTPGTKAGRKDPDTKPNRQLLRIRVLRWLPWPDRSSGSRGDQCAKYTASKSFTRLRSLSVCAVSVVCLAFMA